MAPLGFSVSCRAAPALEVDTALARLDHAPGIYFGCDAGVPGLHPLQATLLQSPALALRVFADGAQVEALDPFGAALLRQPALSEFVAQARRGPGHSALAAARAFLAAFDGAEDALLVGALGFDAHRLGPAAVAPTSVAALAGPATALAPVPVARVAPAAPYDSTAAPMPSAPPASTKTTATSPLGVLFFATGFLRRDAAGAWQHVELCFTDAGLAGPQVRDVDAGQRAATAPGQPAAATATATKAEAEAEAEAEAATAEAATEPVTSAAAAASEGAHEARVAADDFSAGGYAAVVARAVQWLARQPLVSLTLSQSFRRRVGDTASPARAFAALRRANPAPATFFVNTGDGERLFGASPDLQLVVRGREVESFPVCGTVVRGHGPVGEAESTRTLINEEVDAASLAVCSDALRNDLAPLVEPGSLRLRDRRRPMALATVVHTVDRFNGRLRAGVDAWDAIVATAAPVMVTGTPRRLALAAIDALEAGPRGWYGGLIVQVGAGGDARVGTILRAAVVRAGVAEVRTGGDLMADSDPAREEHESRIKAVSLWRALGLSVEAGLQALMAGPASEAARLLVDRLPAAVALHDAGDPFAAAMAETLQGFGLALDPAAAPVVLIGADEAGGREAVSRGAGVVAIGDAAARVLQHAGFAVDPIRPEHGRSMHCIANADLPSIETSLSEQRRAFTAMRYATLAVDWTPALWPADRSDWTVWVHDDQQRPVVLAHAQRRTVCLLLRPDSLLSDIAARDVLCAAVAFAAGPAPASG